MRKHTVISLFILMGIFLHGSVLKAQAAASPEGAFVRSLVVPGWGHYYVNSDQWRRGQIHLGAEVVMIASYFGFSIRANTLEEQYRTLASLKAGVGIKNRSRTFQLALGDFNSLQEYNEFQRRSRNWNRIFDDEPENRWKWKTPEDRENYNELRSDVDRVKNQLPAIVGLMVVNRVVSAISAYNRANSQRTHPELSILPVHSIRGDMGFIANIHIKF